MRLVCKFMVEMKPVSWRLVLQDDRIALAKICRNFIARFRKSFLEQFPDCKKELLVPIEKEIELMIRFDLIYDDNYKTPEKRFIPDLDHTITLIQNALQSYFFEDDRQVASLLVHRWKVKDKKEEKIVVQIYQITD